MDIEIRRATRELAPTLTEIAHAAKRHWNYPERWIESWREQLTITPAFVAEQEVYVAAMGGEVVGFYALVDLGTHWSLDHLWVRPQHMGRGVGRRLFAHAVEHARSLRPAPLRIESDPNAERFYLRMGARRVGSVPADMEGVRRSLPLLELSATAECPMRLDLDVCTVRSWRADDAESLARNANNRKIWRNLRDRFPYPYTPADAEAFLRSVIGATPETSFAIAVNGAAVGGIGLTLAEDIHRRTAEIGYWLGEDHWGRGIASAAVRAVTDYAFAHHDLVRVWAGVFTWNPASMRVLENAGYTREATLRKSAFKDGEVVDEVIFAVVRE